MKGIISTLYTPFEQLANIFTKGLQVTLFESLYNKLDMLYIYMH